MRPVGSMIRGLIGPILCGTFTACALGALVVAQAWGETSNAEGVLTPPDAAVPDIAQASPQSDANPDSSGPTLTLRDEPSESEVVPAAPPDAAADPSAHDPNSSRPSTSEANPASGPSGADNGSKLQPSADPATNTEVVIDPAAFNGITPGVSTIADVQKAWGEPTARAEQDGDMLHLYQVGPFNRVETRFRDGKVLGIVVHLDKAYPAHLMAEHLQLSNVRPVVISDPEGQVIGQTFPEKGVLFSFAPSGEVGKASMLVTQIILDPISAEPFVLRAETFLDSDPQAAEKDLRVALRLDPQHARASWLLAKSAMLLGTPQPALTAARRAVTLQPNDVQFRLTLSQVLAATGEKQKAGRELQRVVAAAENRPHIKARAVCALGELSAIADPPDYTKAVEYFTEAIKIAHPIASDSHPAFRLAAKEVLVDAHLGAAKAIAWGPWEQKEIVVPRWLERAGQAADALTQEGGSPLVRIRVAASALNAAVGVPSGLDPQPWLARLEEAAPAALAEATGVRRSQVQWDLGVALYDAVQCFQIRGEHDHALHYGAQAAELLEAGQASRSMQQTDYYLMGRLYFRLGAIHAIAKGDHTAAVQMFDKAVPLLQKAAENATGISAGRLGETFVSMGVSYWESDQAATALALTEKGIQLLEMAVKAGAMDATVLEIPRSNLTAMRRQAQKSPASPPPKEGDLPSVTR